MESQLHDSINEVLQDVAKPTVEQKPQASNPTESIKADDNNSAAADTEIKDEPVSPEMIESGADLTIGLFDFTQTSIFQWLVKRKKNKKIISLYGENALDKLEQIFNERAAMEENKGATVQVLRELTVEEMGMLRIASRTQEILDDLPMTDQEKDLIKIPLMEIMKRRGGTLPPEYALLLGILQISGARAAELFML